jgi:hypothetical protein
MSEVNIDTDRIMATMRVGLVNGLLSFQLAMSRDLRTRLSKAGTGRVYRVAKGKARGRNLRAQGFHRASAPGNPPAVDTGRLRQSWAIGGDADTVFRNRAPLGKKATKSTQELAVLTSTITPRSVGMTYGSNLKYARALEYGIRQRGLSARPYVRPSIAAMSPKALRIVQTWVNRAFGGK